jgi:hypothetical protein
MRKRRKQRDLADERLGSANASNDTSCRVGIRCYGRARIRRYGRVRIRCYGRVRIRRYGRVSIRCCRLAERSHYGRQPCVDRCVRVQRDCGDCRTPIRDWGHGVAGERTEAELCRVRGGERDRSAQCQQRNKLLRFQHSSPRVVARPQGAPNVQRTTSAIVGSPSLHATKESCGEHFSSKLLLKYNVFNATKALPHHRKLLIWEHAKGTTLERP